MSGRERMRYRREIISLTREQLAELLGVDRVVRVYEADYYDAIHVAVEDVQAPIVNRGDAMPVRKFGEEDDDKTD